MIAFICITNDSVAKLPLAVTFSAFQDLLFGIIGKGLPSSSSSKHSRYVTFSSKKEEEEDGYPSKPEEIVIIFEHSNSVDGLPI